MNVVLGIVCAVLVVGAAFTYFYDPDVKIGAELNGDSTVTVTVGGTLSSEITYHILSDTDVPEKIYLFLDKNYCGKQVSYREQDKLQNSMQILLGNRGYHNTEFIDAERLAQIVSDPAEVSKSGIVMVSGSIPENIYPDASNNGLKQWMDYGGTVYWSGPGMGMYRATFGGDDVKVENGCVFGNSVNNNKEQNYRASYVNDISSAYGYSNGKVEFGLAKDYAGSKVLGLSDDKYSSLSVVPVGSGRAYVLGCHLDGLEVEALFAYVDIIASGITENTVIKESGTYSKHLGTKSFTTETAVVSGDAMFVSTGKPVTETGMYFPF